jgi:prepilin signal peptidase PulO-like enzyme (type II secretory pathway)
MNYRNRRQAENLKKKRMYTPDGYIADPPDSMCPHCKQKQKSCSYVNSLSRAWARSACAKKSKFNNETKQI